MVKGRKITKKEIKKPDEFISATEHVLLFLRDHLKQIGLGVGVVIVLVVAFLLYQAWEENREREARQRLNLALGTLQEISSPYREQSPVEYKNALKKMDEIAKSFPRTSSGKFALLYKGNIHLKLGEFDEAIKAYDTFLSEDDTDKLYRLFAFEGLGYAYEGKKDYAKAIEAYQKIVHLDQGFQAREARRKIGLCYEKMGKNREAVENYKAYLGGVGRSFMTDLVFRKVSLLEGTK